MTRTSRKAKRLRLYEAGNEACPICFARFTEEEVTRGTSVTLEHAPPEAIGGRVVCLTCTGCNSEGSKHDRALADMAREKSGYGTPVNVRIAGDVFRTYLNPDPGVMRDRMNRLATRSSNFANSPLAQRDPSEIALLFEAKARSDYRDADTSQVTIELARPQDRAIELALLRSAYLMVFSFLGRVGYRYAMSESVQALRRQLMNPDEDVAPSCIWWPNFSGILPAGVSREGSAIYINCEPRCWIVQVQNYGIVLPHGEMTLIEYEALIERSDQIMDDGHAFRCPSSSFESQKRADVKLGDGVDVSFGAEVRVRKATFVVVNRHEDLVSLMRVN